MQMNDNFVGSASALNRFIVLIIHILYITKITMKIFHCFINRSICIIMKHYKNRILPQGSRVSSIYFVKNGHLSDWYNRYPNAGRF